MWGYGVGPPADMNPHLVWCRVWQPDLAGHYVIAVFTALMWLIMSR
jgi:hypothetical protein